MIAVRRFALNGVAAAASLCLLCLPLFQSGASAQERPAAQQQAQHAGGEEPKEAPKDTPIPPEKSSVTHHELALGGKSLKYTATAGTLLIRDEDDKPYGSIFYVAYTLDGAEPASRPVSFLYNGGPGSATLWLHMGSFSPVRIETDSPKATAGPPFKLVPNQYSLLDKTDMVFIDAPLTGYSRAVGKPQPKDFAGVDEDLKAFDRFIALYLCESAVEFTEVFDWRIVWHDTVGGVVRFAGQRWNPAQRHRADFIDSELCDPVARLRHHLRFESAELRGGGVVLQQGAEQDSRRSHMGTAGA
jgi:hypothetical protein